MQTSTQVATSKDDRGDDAPSPVEVEEDLSLGPYEEQTQQLQTVPRGQQRELADEEVRTVCAMLREAVALREKYKQPVEQEVMHSPKPVEPGFLPDPFSPPATPPAGEARRFGFESSQGVFMAWEQTVTGRAYFNEAPNMANFTRDFTRLLQISHDAAVNSFCYQRLQKLEARFKLHVMEYEADESKEQRSTPHRDFYNCRKVDTHVHLAAAMNQKHLLRFMKKKIKTKSDEIVTKGKDGRGRTLAQVIEEMGLNAYDLSIDALGMHSDTSIFCRFDKFNLKYNPLGHGNLREIFLKSDNLLNGRYFAEITQELFDDLEESKYQNSEFRISIYGRSLLEWDALANWVVSHRLFSPNNRWIIQIPRLYGIYQASKTLRTFGEMLDNIFLPLFQVSVDPSSHPELHLMLQQVVGFDCVDDESKPEGTAPTTLNPPPSPEQWTEGNPHYAYYCYYIFANLFSLNELRHAQGLSTFCFRPHSGEAGGLDHLHAAFLTARGINHGINLRKTPSLQYLYYLTQIGLALSPLSNNALFLQLSKNPFYEFFCVGLNVSLSTDDPLMFHHTKEPLMEEYCIAKQVWRLSSVDLSEIARNSVLQSSFEPFVKASWIGKNFRLPGVAGNDIAKTNLPNLRLGYRSMVLAEELQLVFDASHIKLFSAPPDFVKVTKSSPYVDTGRIAQKARQEAHDDARRRGSALAVSTPPKRGNSGPATPPRFTLAATQRPSRRTLTPPPRFSRSRSGELQSPAEGSGGVVTAALEALRSHGPLVGVLAVSVLGSMALGLFLGGRRAPR